MFVQLTRAVGDLRLRGPAGLVAAVADDFGAELVAAGEAVELTRAAFDERIEWHTDSDNRSCALTHNAT